MKNTLNKILAAILLVFPRLVSCKKDDTNKTSNPSDYLERLGELQFTSYSKNLSSYNFAGDPLIAINGNVYEWSNSSKEWRKVGNTPPISPTSTIYYLLQDNSGTYYIGDLDRVFTCNGSGNWEPLSGPWDSLLYPGGLGVRDIMTNGNGDMLVRITAVAYYNGNPFVGHYGYYKKPANTSTWSLVKNVTEAEEYTTLVETHKTFYFCDNGNLYYLSSTGNLLFDEFLNTNTGQYEMLYDKTDPAVLPLVMPGVGEGLLNGKFHLKPSGLVYLMEGNVLYKIQPTSLPAKPEKMVEFINPVGPSTHNGQINWTTGLDGFVIDNAGNIKVRGGCNKYPESHSSIIEGTINNADLKLLDHNTGGNSGYSFTVNRQGVFYAMSGGYFFKWK